MVNILVLLLMLCISSSASAATYWVSSTGAASWATCSGSTPLSGASACKLYTANQNATAGDTVYLRAGTYYIGTTSATADGHDSSNLSPGIIPENSGTSGNWLTFMPYSSEVINFIGLADDGVTASVGIKIFNSGKTMEYIRVTGTSLGQFVMTKMYINLQVGPNSGGSTSYFTQYNEIAYIEAYDTGRPTYKTIWNPAYLGRGAWYNHVHHCKFYRHGASLDADTGPCTYLGSSDYNCGDVWQTGQMLDPTSDLQSTKYNVVEYNEFFAGGHSAYDMYGGYNLIRGNYIHNEPWWPIENPVYGYRVVSASGDDNDWQGYNIFEGNRIGHGWESGGHYIYNMGGMGFKLGQSHTIVRHNYLFNNRYGNMSLNTSWASYDPTNSYIYNNTFVFGGFGPEGINNDNGSRHGLQMTGDNREGANPYDRTRDSRVKNNLAYGNWGSANNKPWVSASWPMTVSGLTTSGGVIFSNNWDDYVENGDPLFADETLTSYSSWTLPDLSLQVGSPAINYGTYLTLANGAGANSTTLIVDDSRYFQDAKFGRGITLISTASVTADRIAIGTVGNVALISSITYSTNTITLATPMSWSDNAPIWLYSNSSGAVVLSGTAPDAGAFEYVDSGGGVGILRTISGFILNRGIKIGGNRTIRSIQ